MLCIFMHMLYIIYMLYIYIYMCVCVCIMCVWLDYMCVVLSLWQLYGNWCKQDMTVHGCPRGTLMYMKAVRWCTKSLSSHKAIMVMTRRTWCIAAKHKYIYAYIWKNPYKICKKLNHKNILNVLLLKLYRGTFKKKRTKKLYIYVYII